MGLIMLLHLCSHESQYLALPVMAVSLAACGVSACGHVVISAGTLIEPAAEAAHIELLEV